MGGGGAYYLSSPAKGVELIREGGGGFNREFTIPN